MTSRPFVDVAEAATRSGAEVLGDLDSAATGLADDAEAARRRVRVGPNAVRTHRVSPLAVLVRQLRSALLGLLAAAAIVSYFVGERTEAVVIAVILAVSVGLGFANEYRAERAGAALHDNVRHQAVVTRGGISSSVDVVDLVPGDVVRLDLGMVVPADVRLLAVEHLECDESILTGESAAVAKTTEPTTAGAALGDLGCCALTGTIVRAGSGAGVVVATGTRTAFGRVAAGLGHRQPDTEFQVGLRRFSLMLAWTAGVLTTVIFVINLLLERPLIDAVLFSLAIAVGITPQLLPAVVTMSLAAGTRALAARGVLVKRLVCVEDIGNVEVLFTDKTGTLTEGRISLRRCLSADGESSTYPLLLALLANQATVQDGIAVGGNPLDVALWQSPDAASQPVADYRPVALLPFDHERRRVSVLVDGPTGRLLITKCAPEELLTLCTGVPDSAEAVLDAELAAGSRVVAVASRPASDLDRLRPDDERDLRFDGLLVFIDPPRWRPARRWTAWPASASPSRSSPVIIRRSLYGCAAESASTSLACSPEPTWPDWTTTSCVPRSPTPRSSPGSPPTTKPASCGPSATLAPTSRFSATASTTPSPCTRPTSVFRWTRPPMWPKTPPMCCFWTRTSGCSPTVSSRDAASSPTPSSTC